MTQIPPSQYPPAQMPPATAPYGYGGAPTPRKMSIAALTSLVCGILGCIPFITSIIAVVCGIVGIRKTGNPNVSGRGLAIAGLILGLLGIAGWGIFGGGIYTAYVLSKPARTVAHDFATDLSAGNVSAAAARTAGIPEAELQVVADTMKSWGALRDVTMPGFNFRTDSTTGTVVELVGVATFATGGQKTYTITLVKLNGDFKVQKFDFE